MTLVTGRGTDPTTRLRNEADAAWETYTSTCVTGGTAEQRQWACDSAVRAEMRASKAEDAIKAKAKAKADTKAA